MTEIIYTAIKYAYLSLSYLFWHTVIQPVNPVGGVFWFCLFLAACWLHSKPHKPRCLKIAYGLLWLGGGVILTLLLLNAVAGNTLWHFQQWLFVAAIFLLARLTLKILKRRLAGEPKTH